MRLEIWWLHLLVHYPPFLAMSVLVNRLNASNFA